MDHLQLKKSIEPSPSWLESKAQDLFVQIIQQLLPHEFDMLLKCGDPNSAGIYMYHHEAKATGLVPNVYEKIPWTIEFTLCGFHKQTRLP